MIAEMAEYAATVAGVGEQAARDRGVSVERLEEMRTALRLVQKADRDAFYAVVSFDYAAPAAQAVARCLAVRADSEAEREPTNPNYVPPPGEVKETP